MITHGEPPYLECSSRGVANLSAFHARPKRLEGRSIEVAYQAMKVFSDGTTGLNWKEAKGRHAVNQAECNDAYEKWWREYIAENPELLKLIKAASGLSDIFGQVGHICQATILWKIRNGG